MAANWVGEEPETASRPSSRSSIPTYSVSGQSRSASSPVETVRTARPVAARPYWTRAWSASITWYEVAPMLHIGSANSCSTSST